MRRTVCTWASCSVFWLGISVVLSGQLTSAQETQANAANDTSAAVNAAVMPRLVSMSGALKDKLGAPLTGVQGVTFALYKEQSSGAALWLETQNVTADDQGRFAVLLGATKPEGLPLDLFSADEARWLGVQANQPGEVEQPRVLLVSVPYALKAADAETLGGKPLSAFVLAPNQPGSGLADPSPDSNGAGSSSDGSDPKKKPSPNTAAVTGGTPGTLGKFDADGVSLIDSALKETAGKIGLGVVPSYTFDLQAGAGAQNLLRFFRTGENIFTMSADANENAALFLADGAGAAKVKLGTADGDFRLDMNAGTGAQSVIRVFRPGENIFNFSTDANEHGILFLSDGSGANTIKLHTAGDSFFTSGNVGVGTTAPTAKLDVVGTAKVSTLMFADNTTMTTAPISNAGGSNTFVGAAGNSTTTGTGNLGVGQGALQSITSGSDNTALGQGALQSLTNEVHNTAVGLGALNVNTGGHNTALGNRALTSNTTGFQNTATGDFALLSNTTGFLNTALGLRAGLTTNTANANVSGSSNTFIGANAGPGVNGTTNPLTNATAIGANAVASIDNSLVLGSINGVNGATSDVRVGVGISSNLAKLTVKGTATFTGTGTISATSGSNTISGTGTKFLTEVAVGDRLTLPTTNEGRLVTAIASDTSLTVAGNVTTSTSGSFTDTPALLRVDDSTGSSSRLVLVEGGFGNVGIGTAAPDNKLDVRGRTTLHDRVLIGPNNNKPSHLTVKGITFGTVSGTVAVNSGSNTVTGTATFFLTQLGLGDRIRIETTQEVRTVTAIADNTNLTVDSNFSASANGSTLTPFVSLMRVEAGTANTGSNFFISDLGNIGIGTLLPNRELEVNGGVRLNTLTAKPTCNDTVRGTFWFTQSGMGVADSVEVCSKDAAGVFAWRTLI